MKDRSTTAEVPVFDQWKLDKKDYIMDLFNAREEECCHKVACRKKAWLPTSYQLVTCIKPNMAWWIGKFN